MGFKVITTNTAQYHVINEETGAHVTCDTPDEVSAWVDAYNKGVVENEAAAKAAEAAISGPQVQPVIHTPAAQVAAQILAPGEVIPVAPVEVVPVASVPVATDVLAQSAAVNPSPIPIPVPEASTVPPIVTNAN
jgi:hypothetical protein